MLLRLSVPADPRVPGGWLTDPAQRTAVGVALSLVPFAGIAFLWFIGVLRDRIGHREDRFFGTVFLGSGLLFVAMLFVTAAIAGGLFTAAASSSGPPGPDVLVLGRDVTGLLLNVYSMRMAAVFTLTTVTVALSGVDTSPEHRRSRGRPEGLTGQHGNGSPELIRPRRAAATRQVGHRAAQLRRDITPLV